MIAFVCATIEQFVIGPTLWRVGLTIGLFVGGFVAGLTAGLAAESPRRLRFQLRRFLVGGVVGALTSALVDLIALGPADALRFGLAMGLGVGLVAGLASGLTAPSDLDRVTTPRGVLRNDRSAGVTASAAFGLILGLLYALVASQGAVWSPIWAGYLDKITKGLPIALIVGLPLLLGGAWGRWQLTRSWLALTGRLPWRTRKFLEDAHRRGVLRQAGGVYQFRHGRLQDHLSTMTTMRQPGAPSSGGTPP